MEKPKAENCPDCLRSLKNGHICGGIKPDTPKEETYTKAEIDEKLQEFRIWIREDRDHHAKRLDAVVSARREQKKEEKNPKETYTKAEIDERLSALLQVLVEERQGYQFENQGYIRSDWKKAIRNLIEEFLPTTHE